MPVFRSCRGNNELIVGAQQLWFVYSPIWLIQTKDRHKAGVRRGNKGPLLNELSVAQLDFITLAALQLSAGPAVTQRANAQQRHRVLMHNDLYVMQSTLSFFSLSVTMGVLYQWRHNNAHAN